MSYIQIIEGNSVYQQILKDSFGGVMYNVANKNQYDAFDIIQLRNAMSEGEKDSAGGIMQGVFNFLQGK